MNAETFYDGNGGIPLSSFWRKLVVAHECDGPRLFISGYFVPESQVLLRRNIVEPLNGNQLIAIEPVYIEAVQTKIPTLARVVLAQLLPDDRKIEWASTLKYAEGLLVGAPVRPAISSAEVETDADKLDRARTVFQEMQRQYASGNFARYGGSCTS